MSTGLECSLIEVEPGKWWYLLEQGSAPKNAWDWREFADAYGPFSTEDAAWKHLRDNHANPGGASIGAYEPGYQPDETMKKLMAEADARGNFGMGRPTYSYARRFRW